MRTLPILATAAALVLLAGGCLGSSSAASTAKPQTHGISPGVHPPRPIAHLTVRGVYARGANPDVFGGELQRGHFALTCYARAGYPAMPGTPVWREQLCRAILDYPRAPKTPNGVCACPHYAVHVSIQGSIRGRRVDLVLTPCLCFDSKRAARDTRIVLRLHPRFS
jgi:hypothetical protein